MTPETSRMEVFVTIAKGWKLLTIITKSSILDITEVQLLKRGSHLQLTPPMRSSLNCKRT